MTLLDSHNEGDLLRRIASGDEEAFGVIFHKYHHQLGRFIFRVTENREMAEDITQEAFTKVWILRESLDDVTNFRNWLFTISKNQALNALRQQAKRFLSLEDFTAELASTEDPEVFDPELIALAGNAVENLPPQQKKVYLLSRHEGMTYEQIALQMNISHETVKYYMKLALASIAKTVRQKAGIPGLLVLFSRFL